MQLQTEKLTRTPLKEDIEDSFKETQIRASILRNAVNCNCPGNIDAKFREFVGYFDFLFGISCFKKELNQDIVNKCDKWFELKNKRARPETIQKGLSLFRKYAKELTDKGMIKY